MKFDISKDWCEDKGRKEIGMEIGAGTNPFILDSIQLAKTLGIPEKYLYSEETGIAEQEIKSQNFQSMLNKLGKRSNKYIAESYYVSELPIDSKWPRMNKKKLMIIGFCASGISTAKHIHELAGRKGFARRLHEYKLEKTN